jgi:acyl-coenzyme A thioesterase PaaI-like protein
LQIEDWEVHFVAPGRKGPFLVHAEAWPGPSGRTLARFSLLDEGQSDAVVATGAAAFHVAEHGPDTQPGRAWPRRPSEA